MIVDKEDIRKSTGRFDYPLYFLVCNNSPRYHAYRIHTYMNRPNKMDPDVEEHAKQTIQ